LVGYHAPLQALPATWDEATAQSACNGINLDIGHDTAAGNHDALDFIRKNPRAYHQHAPEGSQV
jgi:hypothetical protein